MAKSSNKRKSNLETDCSSAKTQRVAETMDDQEHEEQQEEEEKKEEIDNEQDNEEEVEEEEEEYEIYESDGSYFSEEKEEEAEPFTFTYDSNDCNVPKNKVTEVIVLDSVTFIDLSDCTKLKSVTLPSSLKEIQVAAFETCEKLTSIDIPKSVTKIGERAFRYCFNLTSAVVPEGVTILDKKVFNNCQELISITLPDSLTEIGEYNFSPCSKLESIRIPPSVTKIGEGVFSDCHKLKDIQFGSNTVLTEIGNYAFYRCESLGSINLPRSVRKIGKSTFYENIKLKSLIIPDGVTTIPENMFEDCANLSSVIIPDSVTEIQKSAFHKCRSLVSIHIPTSVTKIDANAFQECRTLQLIILPKNAQIAGPDTIFEECDELEKRKGENQTQGLTNWSITRFDALPIHKACYYLNMNGDINNSKSSTTVVQYLKKLIENDTKSLTVTDEMGMTPLHVLCCNPNATSEMIKILMAAHPEAAMIRNVSFMSPLDMFLLSRGAISSYEYEDIKYYLQNSNSMGFEEEDDDDDDYYNHEDFIIRNILKASMKKKPKCNVIDMLKTGLNGDVIEVIFALYDGMNIDEKLRKKDNESGLYPFMTAASMPKCRLDVVFKVAVACPDLLLNNIK